MQRAQQGQRELQLDDPATAYRHHPHLWLRLSGSPRLAGPASGATPSNPGEQQVPVLVAHGEPPLAADLALGDDTSEMSVNGPPSGQFGGQIVQMHQRGRPHPQFAGRIPEERALTAIGCCRHLPTRSSVGPPIGSGPHRRGSSRGSGVGWEGVAAALVLPRLRLARALGPAGVVRLAGVAVFAAAEGARGTGRAGVIRCAGVAGLAAIEGVATLGIIGIAGGEVVGELAVVVLFLTRLRAGGGGEQDGDHAVVVQTGHAAVQQAEEHIRADVVDRGVQARPLGPCRDGGHAGDRGGGLVHRQLLAGDGGRAVGVAHSDDPPLVDRPLITAAGPAGISGDEQLLDLLA